MFGIQEVIFSQLSDLAITVFSYLGLALSMAIGVGVIFMAFIALLETLVSRIKGVSVVYGQSDAQPGSQKVVL